MLSCLAKCNVLYTFGLNPNLVGTRDHRASTRLPREEVESNAAYAHTFDKHPDHLHQAQVQVQAQSAQSTMPVATQDVVATLSATLPPHFQQAQLSLANHRKNIVGLHKLQAACSKRTEKTLKGTKLVGEKAFNEIFLACVNRVLGIKKGVANADRIIKFVAAFAICK